MVLRRTFAILLVFSITVISSWGQKSSHASDGGGIAREVALNRLLGSFPATCAEDVAIYGKFAYVADGPGGMLTLDVKDPSKPLLLDSKDTGYAFRVYVHEELCISATGRPG